MMVLGNDTGRLRWACVLLAWATLVGCGARQPPSPEEFEYWSRSRFSADLLSKVKGGQIRFAGGDGRSFESAVIIVGATGGKEGVPAEYLWIARRHGIQGRDWQPVQQSVSGPDAKGRRFDAVTINIVEEWSERTYYFDITELYAADMKLIEKMLQDQNGSP